MEKINKIFILLILILGSTYINIKGVGADQRPESLEDQLYLSLDEVSQLALENNLDIQIAKYDAYIKRNDLFDAESIFDTMLSASASFKDDQKKSSSVFAGTKATAGDYKFGLTKKIPAGTTLGVEFQNTRSWSSSGYTSVNPAYDTRVKFSLNQPIGKNFFGLIDRANIKITKLDIVNSDYSSLDKIESHLACVQKNFWRLILLREQLKIKQEMLDKAAELYEIYKNKHQIGLVEAPDLLASEANVNIRKNDVLVAEEKLNIAKNELLLHLNEENLDLEIYPSDELALDGNMVELIPALNKAIENRRDYQMAKNDVESKNIKLSLKKNNLWPEIDIEASFIRNGISQDYNKAWQDITSEDNPEAYLGVKFSLPLENRQAKGQFETAKLEKAKYLLLLKKVERQILTEINDRVTGVNTTVDKTTTNEYVVELQEKKLQAEEVRFRSGRSNSDLLIRYQQDLLDAKLAFVTSLYEYKTAAIDLKLSQNSLLDEYWKEEL